MANEVDSKIVQMKFDNSNFERNAQTTIKTLEKLNSKSSFQGMADGLNAVDKAAQKVDISPIGKSADVVKVKFTALGTVVDEVYRQITRGAISAGQQLVSSLTVDQVTSGFSKYEDKLTSVRTIMNSTGLSVEEVNDQLQRLNWFTDETSYNFVDMVNNIGKFTNNQIPLKDAVTQMQGIANWAALAGQGVNEASRAMYNISQALGAGVVRLEDWKSIENANMATAEFKQNVLDAAVAMETLVKRGDKYYTVAKGTEVSVSNFVGAMTEEKWFSKDVLLKVLTQYGEFADQVYEVYKNSDMLTSDIIDKMKSMPGFIETVGSRAFAAAQEYRTLGDAISATKDAVSTGWMQTFEIIIGNTEEAKQVWTAFGDVLWDIFASGAEARNDMLKEWREQDGRKILLEGISNGYESLLTIIEPVNKAISEMFPPVTTERLVQMTKAFAAFTSQFKLSEEAAETLHTAVKALLIPFKAVSAVLKMIGSTIAGSLVAGFKFLDWILSLIHQGKLLTTIVEKIDGLASKIFNKDQYDRLLAAIAKIVEKLTPKVAELQKKVADFFNVSGIGELFLKIFNGIFDVIQKLGSGSLEFVVKAFEKIASLDFSSMSAFGSDLSTLASTGLSSVTNGVKYVAEKLTEMKTETENSDKVLANFGSTVGLGAGIVTEFGGDIEYVKASIGGLTDSVEDVNAPVAQTNELMDNLVGFLAAVAKGAADLVKELTPGKILMLSFGMVVIKLVGSFATVLENMSQVTISFTEATTRISTSASNFVNNVGNSVRELGEMFKRFSKQNHVLKEMAILILSITASLVVLSFIDAEALGGSALILGIIVTVMMALANAMAKIDSEGMARFSKSVLVMASALVIMVAAFKLLETVKAQNMLANILAMLTLVGTIGIITYKLSELGKDAPKAEGMIISLSVALVLIANAMKALGNISLGSAISSLVSLSLALTLLAFITKRIDGVKFNIKSSVNLVLACMALNVVAKTVQNMAKIDMGGVLRGLPNFIGMLVLLSAVMVVARLAGQKAAGAGQYILFVSAAMVILVEVIKMISSIDAATLAKGILVISIMMLVMSELGGLGIVINKEKQKVVKMGSTLLVMSAAVGLLSLVVAGLASIPVPRLLAATLSVTLMLGMFGVVTRLAVVSNDLKKATGTIMSITIFVGVLAVAIGLFTLLPTQELLASSISLTAAMAALAAALKNMENLKLGNVLSATVFILGIAGSIVGIYYFLKDVNGKNMLTQSVAIAAALASLVAGFKLIGDEEIGWATVGQALSVMAASSAFIVVMFNSLRGINGMEAIKQSAAIGVALLTLSTALRISDTPHANESRTKQFVTTSMAIMVELAVLFNAMRFIDGVTAVGQAIAIGIAANTIATAFAILSKATIAPGVADNVTKSLKSFAAIAGIMTGVVAVLGIVNAAMTAAGFPPDWQVIATEILGMSVAVVAMATAQLIISKIPPGSGEGAVSALMGLLKVLGIIAAVLVVLGAIDGLFQGGVVEALSRGADIIVQLGEAIGSFFGALIGGFIGQSIGSSLATVQDELLAFCNVMAGISPEAITGVERMASIMSTLSSAAFTNMLSGSDSYEKMFKSLGEGLKSFSPAFSDFAEDMSEFDGTNLEAVSNAALAIAQMSKAFAESKSFFNIAGEVDLGELGDDLEDFGPGLKKFANSVKKLTEADVNHAVWAGEAIGGLYEKLPKTGGWAGTMFGEADLGVFGDQLKDFGEGIVDYSNELTNAKPAVDFDLIVESVKAAEGLVKLENQLKNHGAMWGMFGDSDLDSFGDQLEDFGESLVDYSDVLVKADPKVDYNAIKKSAKAAEGLVALEGKLKNHGDIWTKMFGDSDLTTFGDQLTDFGDGLKTYSDAITANGGIDLDAVDDSVTVAEKLSDLADSMDKGFELFSEETTDFEIFSQNIEDFGDGLAAYGAGINSIDMEKAKDIDTIVEDLVWLSGQVDDFDSEAMSDFVHELNNIAFNAIDNIVNTDMTGRVTTLLTNLTNSMSLQAYLVNPGAKAISTQFFKYLTDTKTIGENATTLFNRISSAFETRNQDMAAIGLKLLGSFMNGLGGDGDGEYKDAATAMIQEMRNTIMQNLGVSEGSSASFELIGGYIGKGIQNGINYSSDPDLLSDVISAMARSAVHSLDIRINYSNRFAQIGNYIVAGLNQGITEYQPTLNTKVQQMAQDLVQTFKDKMKIHSPSIVMKEQGEYLVKGIGEGISSDMSAEEAMQKKAQNIVAAFQDEINKWDLNTTTADLEMQLWQALNPNATEKETNIMQMDLLDKKLQYQAEQVALADAQYQATLKTLGENSLETQEAYNNYLQAQIDLADLAQQFVDANSTTVVDQRQALMDYMDLKSQVYDGLIKSGFGEEEIEQYLRDQTGFDPTAGFNQNAPLTAADIVEQYMRDVVVEVDDHAYQIASRSGAGQSFANGINNSFNQGVENVDQDSIEKMMEEMMTQVEEETEQAVQGVGSLDIFDKIGQLIQDSGNQGASGIFSILTGDTEKGIDELKEVAKNGLQKVGEWTGLGFLQGINDKSEDVSNAVNSVIAVDPRGRVQGTLEINSPSKVYYRIGGYVVEGFANGIKDSAYLAINEAVKMATDAIKAAQQALNATMGSGNSGQKNDWGFRASAVIQDVNNVMKSTEDYEPTIRPVLDLSDVEDGMRVIDNYMGREQTIRVQSTQSKTKQRRQEIQNGSNQPKDKRDTETSGTTYNFTQNNYSPKALSRSEIYRQTRNQFSQLKGRVNSSK